MPATPGLLLAVPPAQLDRGARPRRILNLRQTELATECATGVLAAMRKAQPTVTVHVPASAGNAALPDGNPDIAVRSMPAGGRSPADQVSGGPTRPCR